MKRICVFLIPVVALSIFFNASCREKRRYYEDAMSVTKKMTLEQKIGQMLMIGVPGNSISGASRNIIEKYHPGGIILFGFNLGSNAQTKKFISDLQETSMASTGIPLFISIDQEGGRVWRLADGVTQFPGNMAMGSADDKELVYKAAKILGMQLRRTGINMNLAPVLDVNNNPKNPVINTRSFGSVPLSVAHLGLAYILGLQEVYCIAVAKHFPGHGDTSEDSHLTLPAIPYTVERLFSTEFVPFINAIKGGVEGIMTAHITYPNVPQSAGPATLSKYFLTDILRNSMKFSGIVITDDMEMNAISKNYGIGNAAVKSIEAGTDIILISTHGDSVKKMFDAIREAVRTGVLSERRIEESVNRIIELKIRYSIMGINQGKVEAREARYSEEQLKLLARADEINEALTRKSIFAHNFDEAVVAAIRSGESIPVLASESGYLRTKFSERFKTGIICDEASLAGVSAGVKSGSRKEAIALYHVNTPNAEKASAVIESCRRAGVRLCILSTGNPFPLSAVPNLPMAMYSFSNTRESMNQILNCVAGDFTPATTPKFNMGYPPNR